MNVVDGHADETSECIIFLLYPTLGITDQLFDGYIFFFVFARGSTGLFCAMMG